MTIVNQCLRQTLHPAVDSAVKTGALFQTKLKRSLIAVQLVVWQETQM